MTFELIPAIDILDGRCVRLAQGDYARATVYGDDPAEVAAGFAKLAVPRLHVVDLDGARAGKPVAKLVSIPEKKEPRKGGFWKGQVWVAPDEEMKDVDEEIARLFNESKLDI